MYTAKDKYYLASAVEPMNRSLTTSGGIPTTSKAVATTRSSNKVGNTVVVRATSSSKRTKTKLRYNNTARNSPGKNIRTAHSPCLPETVATTLPKEKYPSPLGASMGVYNGKSGGT